MLSELVRIRVGRAGRLTPHAPAGRTASGAFYVEGSLPYQTGRHVLPVPDGFSILAAAASVTVPHT